MALIEQPAWLAGMFPAGMRRRMVDVDGVEMHVAEWGEGRPVLMIHGNPSWGFLYRKVVAELLAASDEPLRLITPDLIGLGCSDKPRDPTIHTPINHARWLGNLIDRLELDDFVWVGQDWGGPIGLCALEHRLARVRGMVILNTMVSAPRPGFQASKFHRFSHAPVLSTLMFKYVGMPQNMMMFAQGDRRSIMGRTLYGYVWPLRRIADRTAPLAMARMVPDSLEHPSVAALRTTGEVVQAFRGPIHVVWGVNDPILGNVVNHVERFLPHAVITRTDGGHFLQEEKPVEIAAAVRDVLARARAN